MSTRGDDAVSDVVGNILLVGITVALMAGMSVAVLLIGGPEDTLHADLRVDVLRGGASWGDGDEVVRLRHVGGEPVPVGVEVTVLLDGVATTHTPSDLGFEDGALRMGEWWSTTLTIAEGAEVAVVVVDPGANALVASTGVLFGATTGSGSLPGGGTGGGTGGGPVVTYVSSGTATTGTLANLADAQDADDGGAAATLTEATTAVPTDATLSPTTVVGSTGVTGPGNVLQSDNVRARFVGAGNEVRVEGFSVPADATVTSVVLGFEAVRSGGGLPASMTLTYRVSGVLGDTDLTASVSSNSDTTYLIDATDDRATWTPADLAALRLQLVRDSPDSGFRDADVDHVFLRVSYTRPVTDLVATLDFSGVPAASTHQLQLRYSTQGETFRLQVWNGAAWTTRATLDSAAPATLTYTLAAAEHNGGAPRLRLLDADTGAGPGVLSIDYARVEST